MSRKPTRGDIRTGDVSGTVVVGDHNQVTTTTHHRPEQPQPQQRSGQANSAEDQAAVFALERGTMHVTYHAAPTEPEPED